MIYGYARVWTNGQSVAAQAAALRKHRAGKVFREGASGAKTDRPQLRRLLDQLDDGDVVMVTRLDRLARSSDGEPVRETAPSYNVSHSTISRLAA
jgi:DNA invertase Pin-like site-specific DNA recombinase